MKFVPLRDFEVRDDNGNISAFQDGVLYQVDDPEAKREVLDLEDDGLVKVVVTADQGGGMQAKHGSMNGSGNITK